MSLHYCRSRHLSWCSVRSLVALFALLAIVSSHRADAQTTRRYVYFPSPSITDGRFLSMAGSGLNTLGEDIVLKLAVPGATSSIEIGIFDGETGGQWDQGTVQMDFTLYADPKGDGSGTTRVQQWSGSQMADNSWFSATVPHVAGARGANGDYFYILRVSNPNPSVMAWSNFKIRTSGTVVALIDRPFAYTAPLHSLADARVIFPNYPTLTPTTYDGSWSFFIQLNRPATSLTVWDGDMDHGSYDCSVNDTDDPDTPNNAIPAWASGNSAAVPEGLAASTLPCSDAAGNATGGTTTSNPADDARNEVVRRSPNVSYELIDPRGVRYANTNPSGNLEWEQFRIATGTFNRNLSDYRADSLPAGVYEIRISGVDMNNLNAWRFPYDALGVDSTGTPVTPIRPGQIVGDVYYDVNNNGRQDSDEPGIPAVTVELSTGATAVTDKDGHYVFPDLEPGTYVVKVDDETLAPGVSPTGDADGVRTPNSASVTVTEGQTVRTADFGYKRNTSSVCSGTKPVGYWVNNTRCWPLSRIKVGCTTYTQAQALLILRKATAGDKTYLLAAELITAKLNIADDNDPSRSVENAIEAAGLWLSWNPIGSGVGEASGCGYSSPWSIGKILYSSLQSFNSCKVKSGCFR